MDEGWWAQHAWNYQGSLWHCITYKTLPGKLQWIRSVALWSSVEAVEEYLSKMRGAFCTKLVFFQHAPSKISEESDD